MDGSLLLDPYKLRHWLNARKFTPSGLRTQTELPAGGGVFGSSVTCVRGAEAVLLVCGFRVQAATQSSPRPGSSDRIIRLTRVLE